MVKTALEASSPVEVSRTPPMGESTVQDRVTAVDEVMAAAELSVAQVIVVALPVY